MQFNFSIQKFSVERNFFLLEKVLARGFLHRLENIDSGMRYPHYVS